MRANSYPSDVTDEQWALIEPLIPVYPGGRPRTTDVRDVLDAILYLLRTGCQWRYLPKDFPPKSTVWRYFDEWRHHGTLEAIHDKLREKVRKRDKPGQPRHTASIDSQSVDTSSGGQATGRDNAKNVDGRKRHLIVDSLGLLLAVELTFAWLAKCRRLSVDREKTTRSAEAMIRLAMIHLMLNRLCPKEGQQEFRYRKAS